MVHAPFKAKADSHVVATACFYRTARTVADTAELLGRADDAQHLRLVAGRVRAAFNQHYVQENGTCKATAPPSTRWPSFSACSTTS